jgi:Type IV secretion system pilin
MKKNLTKLMLFVGALISPALAFAQAQIPEPPVTAPGQINNINQILSGANICTIINWAFWLFIVASIIFTLGAAFKYLTAAGDPEKVKSAGASLLYVVIAIVVALLAKGLPLIISSFIGGGLTSIGC